MGLVGEALKVFFGNDQLPKIVCAYCEHQQYALEVLKTRVKKDSVLSKFLCDMQSHPLCRKLQLQVA